MTCPIYHLVGQFTENQAQGQELLDTVISRLYVDDFVGGCNTVEEACKLKQKVTETLKEGRFTMRMWKANSEEFRQHISIRIQRWT